jgi:hypothetical protein
MTVGLGIRAKTMKTGKIQSVTRLNAEQWASVQRT